MQTKILKSLQPGSRYCMESIARRAGLSRRATQSVLESLVSMREIVRDVVTRPGGNKTVYYHLPLRHECDGTECSPRNQSGKLSSRDVLFAMEAGVGYTSSDLARRLGVDVKKIHAWLPRLRNEHHISESIEKHRPRIYYLSGTEPEAKTPPVPTTGKPVRIANGCINEHNRDPFDAQYARELERLVVLSKLARQRSEPMRPPQEQSQTRSHLAQDAP